MSYGYYNLANKSSITLSFFSGTQRLRDYGQDSNSNPIYWANTSFHLERRTNMKRISTTKTSARSDDAPKLTQAQLDRAKYQIAGKKVSKADWQEAVRKQLAKRRISIMLDAVVIDHFKATAGERGYQTLINDTLRRAVTGDSLFTELRTVLREELAAYR
jgi:uncharacterized protein (DUF4415 family)